MVRDEELLEIARNRPGSPAARDAAAELLGRYQRAVYVRALRYVKDPDRAMDMTQDVLLSAYENLGSFEGRSRFASWLFSIARNRCLNEVRRIGLLSDDGFDPDWVPDRGPGVDEQIEQAEDERRLLDLIGRTLDPMEQQAIWLRCRERLSIDEITRLLGLDGRTGARGLLQTARRKLKRALETEGNER